MACVRPVVITRCHGASTTHFLPALYFFFLRPKSSYSSESSPASCLRSDLRYDSHTNTSSKVPCELRASHNVTHTATHGHARVLAFVKTAALASPVGRLSTGGSLVALIARLAPLPVPVPTPTATSTVTQQSNACTHSEVRRRRQPRTRRSTNPLASHAGGASARTHGRGHDQCHHHDHDQRRGRHRRTPPVGVWSTGCIPCAARS